MTHDAFISYASEDKSVAEAACRALESVGVACWIAPRDIPPGSEWEAAIVNAIESSKIMVLIFSGHANCSKHVQREVGHAFENGVTVIQFRVSEVSPSEILRYYLRSVQWLDACGGKIEDHIAALSARVRDLLFENQRGVSEGDIMSVFRDDQRNLFVKLRSPLEATGLSLSLIVEFGQTKGLLGPSSNPSDQTGFHNQANTLFGINHQPCTKCSQVHLFIFDGGNFALLNDVNDRVARLLGESSELGFLRIEVIDGDVVKMQTVDFRERPPYPRHDFSVRVRKDATIELIE